MLFHNGFHHLLVTDSIENQNVQLLSVTACHTSHCAPSIAWRPFGCIYSESSAYLLVSEKDL